MRIVTTILEIGGLAALGYGLWQYDPRLTFVVCGTIVLIGGALADMMMGKG